MTEEVTGETAQERKKEECTPYCPICTHMGRKCQGRTTASYWDNEEELRDTPKIVMVTPIPSPQLSKTYKQPYFDDMLNNSPPSVTLRSRRMQEIIQAQEKVNKTIRNFPQQNLINEVE